MPGVPDMDRPKQPQTLQGLLRYAIDTINYSDHEDEPLQSPQLIDEEKRKFLSNAISSMTVNVTKLMKEQIALLNVPNVLDGDLREKLHAFDLFTDYVDDIDMAIDFHKINGFSVFEPCFRCENSKIRAGACNLLAELAQNNPYIQKVVCECTPYMARMLEFVENDPDEEVQIKAIYAISCITRDSEYGYETFKRNEGVKFLKKPLGSESVKVRTKVGFFLTSICKLDPTLVDTLVELGYAKVLVEKSEGDWNTSHEHILSLLKLLVEKNATVKDTIRAPWPSIQHSNVYFEYNLKEILVEHLQFVRGKEEYKEEEQYCEAILKAVYEE